MVPEKAAHPDAAFSGIYPPGFRNSIIVKAAKRERYGKLPPDELTFSLAENVFPTMSGAVLL